MTHSKARCAEAQQLLWDFCLTTASPSCLTLGKLLHFSESVLFTSKNFSTRLNKMIYMGHPASVTHSRGSADPFPFFPLWCHLKWVPGVPGAGVWVILSIDG